MSVSGAAAGGTGAAWSRLASSLQALPSRPRWLVSEWVSECVSGAAAGGTGFAGSRIVSSLQALPSRPRWLVSEWVSE